MKVVTRFLIPTPATLSVRSKNGTGRPPRAVDASHGGRRGPGRLKEEKSVDPLTFLH